jgi:hypothetical protein
VNRPPFLAWAIKGMIAARGDWVFTGSENEANAFLVNHYYRLFSHKAGYR